tara:strand:+ start:85 stop:312 length:228 start_codon:yes stop_codon:yes gene_type:complete
MFYYRIGLKEAFLLDMWNLSHKFLKLLNFQVVNKKEKPQYGNRTNHRKEICEWFFFFSSLYKLTARKNLLPLTHL